MVQTQQAKSGTTEYTIQSTTDSTTLTVSDDQFVQNIMLTELTRAIRELTNKL